VNKLDSLKMFGIFLTLFTLTNLQAGLEEFSYYEENLPQIQKSQNKKLIDALYTAIKTNKTISYKDARTLLFGTLHLEGTEGQYYIKDSYCQKTFTKAVGVGPGQIPNHNEINCEHTWPQSRFNSRENRGTQKGDLHHLFPVDARANSTRGNIPFGEVDGDQVTNCPQAERGDDIYSGISSFEPSKYHKGNVARALFYFSVRYKISIDDSEEIFLRQWHKEDPIDQDEVSRNEKIFNIQGNRNPFIDDPKLVDQIDNF
jgi:deoxyribonuclease I